MNSTPRFWADLSTADFAQRDMSRTVAVLPVAATEQHGPHLPLSVDTDLVNGVVQASLAHLAADLPVALAVSLHAPNDELRDNLVPLKIGRASCRERVSSPV